MLPILALSSLLGAGCDSSAHSGAAAPDLRRAPGESGLYETCSTSSQCVEDLRCLDSRCQTGVRSRLGDYHAADGRRWLAAGDAANAARAYNLAVTEYEKEGLIPPPDLFCEQGRALVEGRDDGQLAEAAARILHKCILAVPLSSEQGRTALDALAVLSEAGLDFDLLARGETADLYMTREAQGPDLDELKLKVSGDTKNKRRSYTGLLEALKTPAAKSSFAPCWIQYVEASKEEALRVELNFSYRFVLDEDDESRDRAVLELAPQSPPSDGDLAKATQCVEQKASALSGEFAKTSREDTRWKGNYTIVLAP